MAPLRVASATVLRYASGMEVLAVIALFAVEVAVAGSPELVIVRAATVEEAVLEAVGDRVGASVLSVYMAIEREPGVYQLGLEVPLAVAA